jgi:hypothetical protein
MSNSACQQRILVGNILFSPRTLFNPQYSDFIPVQKLRKIHSEVRIQGKKNFGKCILNFKIKGKKGNPRGKKSLEGWVENLSLQPIKRSTSSIGL